MSNRLRDYKTSFIHDEFLLQNEFAGTLYHDYAKHLPIIDYHNHLAPDLILENINFSNISAAWLAGDHYKWRSMRTLGIDEHYITGASSVREKFEKWAATVPYTIRNPLYHWTHLELKRYFDIDELLTPDSAGPIFEETKRQLQQPSHTTIGLLKGQNVEVVCTTDDPIDNLEAHIKFAAKTTDLKMSMAFRPDKAYALEHPKKFNEYLTALEEVTASTISTFENLLEALETRIDYFHKQGCRLSDHGLEYLPYVTDSEASIDDIFRKIRSGKFLEKSEMNHFKFETLRFLCKKYHAKGWVQQFHLGALRSTNSRMLKILGPDTGYDSIGDFSQARNLALFMDHLDSTDQLTKTIIYNLNPADNEIIASMIGNFNDGSSKGKIQFGSGWWFLDQKDGMEKQLNALSNIGLLSCFIGMLTDSRSFLSFPRHEYFRRVLCNLIGKDVENGELPADEKWLGKIVSDICYTNAKNYFRF